MDREALGARGIRAMSPVGRLRCSVPFLPPIRVSGALAVGGGMSCDAKNVLSVKACDASRERMRRSVDGYRLFALTVGMGYFEELPSDVCMVMRGTYASPCVFELRRNLYFCPLEMYGVRRWKEGKRVRL